MAIVHMIQWHQPDHFDWIMIYIILEKKSKHAIDRQAERRVSDDDIQDALKYPLIDPCSEEVVYNTQGKPGIRFVGRKVTVIQNLDDETDVTFFEMPKHVRRRYEKGL